MGHTSIPRWGRPNSRVTSRHLDHSSASRAFMSRSKRPYGFTCSHISGVTARRSVGVNPYGRFELDMETRLDLSPNGPW